eukprot:3184436-Rhodomonas_salina.3
MACVFRAANNLGVGFLPQVGVCGCDLESNPTSRFASNLEPDRNPAPLGLIGRRCQGSCSPFILALLDLLASCPCLEDERFVVLHDVLVRRFAVDRDGFGASLHVHVRSFEACSDFLTHSGRLFLIYPSLAALSVVSLAARRRGFGIAHFCLGDLVCASSRLGSIAWTLKDRISF